VSTAHRDEQGSTMTPPLGGRRSGIAIPITDLVASARALQPQAVARLISLVESNLPVLREVSQTLAPFVGRAQVVGITGAPGVGKSTTTSALTTVLRQHGRTVGILSVDPSSPYTGGAFLGDRIRMQDHATDNGVFVRSLASRGRLGGLSAAVPQALRVLDASGFDVVLIETVGVGQAELEIASLADTTLVILAPGAGDSVQAAKAGILEIADVLVVNKADREGAAGVVRDLQNMQSYKSLPGDGWAVPTVQTVATDGVGITNLVAAMNDHFAWLQSTSALAGRRQRRATAEVEAIVLDRIRARFASSSATAELEGMADKVAHGVIDPYSAADLLFPP
jgi:LAO/AO transport system kinase